MKKYIIVTPEGSTIAPKEEFLIENLQVLGLIDNVNTESEAIDKLLEENQWIIDAQFNVKEFITYELL
ncbi:MAG TPA: hypothetical protein PK323_00100 [Bacteroidia bacterium]|nr:hypothetical protein [Bacteroidia bacterium]